MIILICISKYVINVIDIAMNNKKIISVTKEADSENSIG